ncbi:MAG: efflux RND transporter permease subunit [Pirellulaceae bacterium]
MLVKLIEFSLNNRFLIIVGIALVAGMGLYNALRIPIDAVPDMTNTQVQILTSAGSLSPLEVEQLVSYPVEATMAGVPNVEEIRSISKLGLSVVTVVFEERTDLTRARNLIIERLPEAKSRVGAYGDPQIGTPTTALGEVLQFEVRGEGYSPMQLRSILEWQVAPRLRETKGVTEINSHGGYYKTYEIQVDPERLATLDVNLMEVIEAIENNNQNAGGGYIVHNGEQQFVRGQAFLQSANDIRNVVIRARPNGLPILVGDVGVVELEPLTRQGLVTRDGRGEIVTGMVMMLRGENSRIVVEAAKEKLADISKTLPKGVSLEILYDRAHLINRTLNTVLKNLAEGGLLVVVVLFVMLGNFRAGLIVALAIPLSMMFATNLMMATAISRKPDEPRSNRLWIDRR